ncbi:PGF-CTERM sorting domain-containing protein [Halorubrum sp. AD140]|uniref:PGF-CTERM sorting domain-containing protein n=1 Tax=Halorubrum sp. AD140 TaxID=3050073 RepID=UPI002ACC4AD5|nr:PGF-CTERM sorting domain-containing protein [Halorubrum sp. AD140]MDZ5811127.1 PGF-CTERM sorting domain-containing protein [Halorubrum sp. AD140]
MYSEEDPIRIDVGELVEAGAEFDQDNSSYDLKNGQTANESEVYIKNPGTSNATIIVSPSAIDNLDSFDLEIEHINTTNVSKYNGDISKINNEIEYESTQDGESDLTSFHIQHPAIISTANNTYDNETNEIKFEEVDLINNTTNRVLVWKTSSEGELIEKIGANQGQQQTIKIDNESISGKVNIAVTVHPHWTNSSDIIYAKEQTTITAPESVKLLQSPTHYQANKSQDLGTVSLKTNTRIEEKTGSISIKYFNQSSSDLTVSMDSSNVGVSNNTVKIDLDSIEALNNKSKLYIEDILVKDLKSIYGGTSLSTNSSQITRTSERIHNKSNITVSQGTKMEVASNKSEVIKLQSKNENITPETSIIDNQTKLINTTKISADKYTLESNSSTNGSQVEVINTSFSPKTPTTSESEGVFIQFNSVPNTRNITIHTQNKDRDFTKEKQVSIEKEKEQNTTIRDLDPGKYDIRFWNTDSGESVTRSTDVLASKEANLSLESDTDQIHLGTKANSNLSNVYNNTALKISEKDSNTTVATAELATPSPGRTSVGINTYAVGNDSLSDDLITTGPGASVESIQTSTPNGTLSPGTYEISVESEQGLATAADNATVTVRNRSTREMTAYATTEAGPNDLDSADAVRAGISNETLSPTSTVGANETVVYSVNASGLSGLPAARNATLDTGADLDRLDGLAFGVRETASTNETTTSEDADDIGSVPPNSTVHLDDDGLYLVAEGTDALATDGAPSDGESFAAEFHATDDRLREAASNSDADHAAVRAVTFDETTPDTGPTESTDENGSHVDEESVDGDGGGAVGTETGGEPSTDGEPSGDDRAATGGETAAGDGSEDTGGSGGVDESSAEGGGPSASDPRGDSDDRGAAPKTADARSEIRPAADLRTAELNGSVAVLATSASDTEVPAVDEDDVDRAGGEGAESTESDGGDTGSEAVDDSEPESDTDETEPETPDYEDAPIRTTADDVPGFGPLVALLALAATAVITRNRG